MANTLKKDKQIDIIHRLVEHSSIRAIERQTGVHRDTIMRLGVRVGGACQLMHADKMKALPCNEIQVDEIWSYVLKKQKNLGYGDYLKTFGDTYTFVAMDPDTKLIPSYLVGKRCYEDTVLFLKDLRSRLQNRIQLSSDQFKAYAQAVDEVFGTDVDYGQIVKTYIVKNPEGKRLHKPYVTGVNKSSLIGKPRKELVSTSYVERQNLTMRMHCKRMARLTNAFSKKLENFKAAIALHFAYYNFVKIHSSLKTTPAIAIGIEKARLSIGDLVDIAGNNEYTSS